MLVQEGAMYLRWPDTALINKDFAQLEDPEGNTLLFRGPRCAPLASVCVGGGEAVLRCVCVGGWGGLRCDWPRVLGSPLAALHDHPSAACTQRRPHPTSTGMFVNRPWHAGPLPVPP